MRSSYLCLLSLLLIAGCGSTKEDFKNRTPDSIYQKGLTLLNEGEYTEAAEEFKDIETLFPYSSIANEGQILSAYSYFKAKSYQDAIREIEVFLRYHPANKLVPYAMYLKAMCLYMQVASVGRDAENALEAKKAFVALVNKFPTSDYREDSLEKIIILDDITAAHEMAIGRYYQKNKNALAAIGRYNFVVSRLPHTDFVPEALFRMVECCSSLGLKEEATNAYAALKHDFPNSDWLQKADLLIKNK
ncbi:MAG: outer membrane protein assembly factor BamD [Alphaproteobacteria bacterium]|nr:outer membrane protein assembly factor BamD [Alphaproteobacteria bacterium]